MKPDLKFALRLHGWLLRLYPPGFRRDFGPEVQSVFAQAAEQASMQGGGALIGLCLRELRDLPGAALAEHLRARRLAQPWPPQNEDRPGTWGQALGAALPHLFIAVAFSLPELFLAGAPPGGWLEAALLPSLLAVLGLGLLAGWRKGWPRWSAGWLAYGLFVGVMLMEDRLLNGFGGTGDRPEWNTLPYLGRQMLSEIVVPCVLVAALYFLLTHRDLIMGLLAALPLAQAAWLFHLEFVPPVPALIVNLVTWAIIGLAAGAIVRRGRRASGVWLAVAAGALVGLLYSYGAVFLRRPESSGPHNLASVWAQFSPDFLGWAALLLGLALARRLWEHGRPAGRPGRAAAWLAFAGLLSVTASLRAAYRLFLPDDLSAFQPMLGPWLRWAGLSGALVYVGGVALIAVAAWKTQRPFDRAAFAGLALLLFLAPWVSQMPRLLGAGLWPVVLPNANGLPSLGPLSGSLALAWVWLALAVWAAARSTPAPAPPELLAPAS